MLDPSICSKARLSRDKRFDGRFFTCVHTTGIFCRPICPAPAPLEKNVTYLPSAAAAMAQGFRPCLRCRPEASPQSAAWKGTQTTASRAFQLVQDGYLAGHSVSELAARLGVGERHLSRLCKQYFHASPKQIEQTRRLLLAKQLLTHSNLDITQVGLACGFASIRSFNEAFAKYYARPPGEIRKGAHAIDKGLFLAPADTPGLRRLFAFWQGRQIAEVEAVNEHSYSRCLRIDGHALAYKVELKDKGLYLFTEQDNWEVYSSLLSMVKRQFDLELPIEEMESHLSHASPILASVIEQTPGMRIPGSVEPFEVGIRAIIGQQISVKGALTMLNRLVAVCGDKYQGQWSELTRLFPTPEAIVATSLDGMGFTQRRIDTLKAFSRAVIERPELMSRDVDPQWRRQALLAISGIGPWTVNYLELRGFSEPDAFPAGDLGVRKALVHGSALPSEKQVEHMSQPWRPWRAYAALHLWQSLTQE